MVQTGSLLLLQGYNWSSRGLAALVHISLD
jgi:hypothetical protein